MKRHLKLLLPLLLLAELTYTKATTVINNSEENVEVWFTAGFCFGIKGGKTEVCKHQESVGPDGNASYNWKKAQFSREVLVRPKKKGGQTHVSNEIKTTLNYPADFHEER